MAGRIRRPIIIIMIIIILLSIAPEKGTVGAHKKRSGITYVICMVVMPLPDGKEEGIWMMKGGSRIWRRIGEREATTSQTQTEWITAKAGARQKNLSADTRVRVSNRFSMLQLDDQGEGEFPAEVRHLVVGDS